MSVIDMTDSCDLFAVCASGDTDKLREVLEVSEDELSLLNVKNTQGKTLLEVACIFGRLGIIDELVQLGATLDSASERGYTCAHWAACWGMLDILKYVLNAGVDITLKNVHQETARDIAVRYFQHDCALFLEKEECLRMLRREAARCKDIVNDNEKNLGRFGKDDKISGNKYCEEKLSWAEQNRDTATADQFRGKMTELKQQLKNIFSKLEDSSD